MKQNGRIGLYYVGNWPSERGAVGPSKAPASAYANPAGFIEVTPQNADTPLSEHFKLRDFLTHDQPNVWPKYLVIQPKLIDKLELVLADLQAHGIDVHGVRVMSGFRTPQQPPREHRRQSQSQQTCMACVQTASTTGGRWTTSAATAHHVGDSR